MQRSKLAVLLWGAVAASAYAQKPTVLAYYPSDDAYNDLVAMHGYINEVSTDVFAVDAQGNISGSAPTAALKVASAHKIKAYAVISNYGDNGFDAAIAHSVMSNRTCLKKFLTGMRAILKTNRYQGVNIDFEGFFNTDRKLFNAFLKAVVAEVNPGGFTTMVSVPAKTVDDPTDTWSGGFDYITIGKTVDMVQVMTYDEYGVWSEPGPVSGLDWMKPCLKYSITAIPKAKVLLGIPAYANDWNLTDTTGNSNVSIQWTDMTVLLKATHAKPVRDEITDTMHFRYTAIDGSLHEVWYDDAGSIQAKTNLFETYKLAGVSVWALGQEDANFWNAVTAGLKNR